MQEIYLIEFEYRYLFHTGDFFLVENSGELVAKKSTINRESAKFTIAQLFISNSSIIVRSTNIYLDWILSVTHFQFLTFCKFRGFHPFIYFFNLNLVSCKPKTSQNIQLRTCGMVYNFANTTTLLPRFFPS